MENYNKMTREELLSAIKIYENRLQADIEAFKKLEENLNYRLAIEKITTTIAMNFLKVPFKEIDKEINKTLKALGKFIGVDRCFIALFSDDVETIEQEYEWSEEGIKSRSEYFVGMNLNPFSWSMEKLRNLEYIYISDLDELPPEAEYEKTVWQSMGVKSFIVIPLQLNGTLIGLMGFDIEREEKTWKEEDINFLKVLEEIFISVLERKKVVKEFIKLEILFEKLIHSNKKAITVIEKKGLINMFNPAAEGLFGYKREEIKGQPIFRLISEKDQKEIEVYMNSYFSEHERTAFITKSFHINSRDKQDNVFPVEISLSPAKFDKENYLLCTFSKI